MALERHFRRVLSHYLVCGLRIKSCLRCAVQAEAAELVRIKVSDERAG